jgi:hypothetical protein
MYSNAFTFFVCKDAENNKLCIFAKNYAERKNKYAEKLIFIILLLFGFRDIIYMINVQNI